MSADQPLGATTRGPIAIATASSLIFSLVQPLVFLGLFGPLLVGTSGAPVGETLRWCAPGVLVMIVLFGTGTVGSNLQYEMMTGSQRTDARGPAVTLLAAGGPRTQGGRADHRAGAADRADRVAVRLLLATVGLWVGIRAMRRSN